MRTLLLSPHNLGDDETLFASYLCLMYEPHVIVCLRSARMADPNYPGGMPISAETRELETAAAMEVLGCTWEQWQILDNYPRGWERQLRAKLSTLDPDLIFAPAPELGGHQQHNVIGEMASKLFGDRTQHYLTYTSAGRSTDGVQVPHPPGWVDTKRQALSCYRSQAEHPATKHWFEQEDLREFIV